MDNDQVISGEVIVVDKPKIQTFYKRQEYKKFIQLIKDPACTSHWVEIAEALGISKDTITIWKTFPEAQEARRQGIELALAGMENAGRKDWKMYETKLKMLGINPADKIEHDGKIEIQGVVIYRPNKNLE